MFLFSRDNYGNRESEGGEKRLDEGVSVVNGDPGKLYTSCSVLRRARCALQSGFSSYSGSRTAQSESSPTNQQRGRRPVRLHDP